MQPNMKMNNPKLAGLSRLPFICLLLFFFALYTKMPYNLGNKQNTCWLVIVAWLVFSILFLYFGLVALYFSNAMRAAILPEET